MTAISDLRWPFSDQSDWLFLHGASSGARSELLNTLRVPPMGRTPSTAGTFRKKFRKNSGKTPETLSERFLEFPSRVRLGCPKPYNSERFQNSLPPSTAGDASFFRIGSGEGLSELVMEFPAVLGVFLTHARGFRSSSGQSSSLKLSSRTCDNQLSLASTPVLVAKHTIKTWELACRVWHEIGLTSVNY